MNTPTQALKKILRSKFACGREEVVLEEALNRVLTGDVISPVSHPLFSQSAVDGYAVRLADVTAGTLLKVAGETKAGDAPADALKPGEAVRIFTGAAVPFLADAVVMQEEVLVIAAGGGDRPGTISVRRGSVLPPGANIRREGEQLKKGEVALPGGAVLNPAAIGHLASLGISRVTVSRKPVVRIIVTGSEFASAKRASLPRGALFESNGRMLSAALQGMGIPSPYLTVPDNLPLLCDSIAGESAKSDVLLITGGVSVGKYDFTRTALEKNSYRVIIHGVSQKPGKPLLFAAREGKAAFGLPGNPRSALICFYLYVVPFLFALQGCAAAGMPLLRLPLASGYRKKEDDKVHYLAARVSAGRVEILEGQGSHMLGSLAGANALAVIPAESSAISKGGNVEVFLLQSLNVSEVWS